MKERLAIDNDWPRIRSLLRDSFLSSLHYAIATVDADGRPHVTPIGSLILGEPGHGFYFEEFTTRLAINLESNPNLSVLAVNSGRWFWVRSLLSGGFAEYPAIRLTGVAGERRDATQQEIERWQRRVRMFRGTRGYRQLWKNMRTVREIRFTGIDTVELGSMTSRLSSEKTGLRSRG